MKRPLLFTWLLIFAASISLSSITVLQATDSAYPTISVHPTTYKGGNIGETFKINVTIQDVIDLAGLEFRLGYNTAVLTATQIDYGGIFGDNYLEWISSINDAQGWLHYGVSRDYGRPSFNGSAVVATVTFEVTESGSTVLDLYETQLGDSLVPPSPIIHTVIDGFFFNEPFHDIGVTEVMGYPGEVKSGEIVSVNVTVTNGGNYSETFNVIVYADIAPYQYIRDAAGALVAINIAVGDEIIVGTQAVNNLASGATTTVTLSWNTTEIEEGNYTMSAKSLLADDDTRNNLFIGGMVKIEPPALLHDVAVTAVAASPNEVTVGENVTITVNVKNKGNFSETFDVSTYYGNTLISSKTGLALTNGTDTTLTFTWDTTGVSEGTYTIKAEIPPVVGEREANKADNTYIDGTVTVRGAAGSDMTIYAVIVIVIIVVAAIVLYFLKFRK